MKILVIYHTRTGHTLEAITPIIEGLKATGADVDLLLAKKFNGQMLSEYNAFIVGTPCWGGSTGIAGIPSYIKKAINKIEDGALEGKLCGGVAIHSQYGGKATLKLLEKLLAEKGCGNFIKAPVVKAGVPMSLYKGPSVTQESESQLKIYGEQFAEQAIN